MPGLAEQRNGPDYWEVSTSARTTAVPLRDDGRACRRLGPMPFWTSVNRIRPAVVAQFDSEGLSNSWVVEAG
jgi:hypothetical protein